MIEALKKLIIKHGGTYDRYDNTELELFRRLCDALKLPYDKYMDVPQLFNLVAEKGIVPSGGESSGGGNSNEGGIQTWEQLIPKYILPVTSTSYRHYSKDGKYVYYSNNGIIRKDLKTGEDVQLYDTGSWSNFFEDSQGNIYVSSGSSTKGVLYIGSDEARLIYDKGYNWENFFEDPQGRVYVGGPSGAYGCLYLTPEGAYAITTNGYNCTDFYKFNNACYASGYSMTGVILLDGYNSKTLINKGTAYKLFESSAGIVYAGGQYTSSSGDLGIYIIENDTAQQIYNLQEEWSYFFESSNGDIYVGGAEGLVRITDKHNTELILSTGRRLANFFESSNGDIYVGGCGYAKGLWHISGSTVTQVLSIGDQWVYYEDSNNNVYGFGHSVTGIYKLQGTNYEQLYTEKTGWASAFEAPNGCIYIQGAVSSNAPGLFEIANGTYTYLTTGGPYIFFLDENNNAYTLRNSYIYVLPGDGTCTSISLTSSTYSIYNIEGKTYVCGPEYPTLSQYAYCYYVLDGTVTRYLL